MVVVASEKPDPEDKQDGLTRDTDKPAFDPGFRRERAMSLASRLSIDMRDSRFTGVFDPNG